MHSILSSDVQFVNLLLQVQIRQPSEESGFAVRVNDILRDIGPGLLQESGHLRDGVLDLGEGFPRSVKKPSAPKMKAFRSSDGMYALPKLLDLTQSEQFGATAVL